jgi:hypothetical protein
MRLGDARAPFSLLAGLVLLILVAGCGGGPAPTTSRGGSDPPPSGSLQSPSAVATGPSAVAPTGSTSPPAPPEDLPAAVIDGPSGPIAGSLGSWALDGQGSDSPWLPASALRQAALESRRITVRFAGDVPIGAWTARIAPAGDRTGETATALGEREAADPPLPAVVLEAAPPGRWVLSVRLDRADGRGDATFYWLLRVG